jgi:D-alanyl-D-alanine carboxypeptidase
MKLSYTTKRLLVSAILIIGLAFAANAGLEERAATASPTASKKVAYPDVPGDIDPEALDYNGATLPRATGAPKPVVIKPLISAEAYLVANLETGEIYAEHNSKTVFPIASLSKLVTALTALRNMRPDQKITITQPMLDAYGDAGHLVLGETYTVSELLMPMLLESSNDAAEAFAYSYGYPDFIQKMNALAVELGMTSTSFKDASGLSSGNISNAENLFILAKYIYSTEKPLLELTRQTVESVATTTDHGSHVWHTINPFPLDPHFIGGKTGRTVEAKESMISLFRYTTATASYPIAIIVLRSDFSEREVDSDYLFEQFIQKIDKI